MDTHLNRKNLMLEVPALLLQAWGIWYLTVPDVLTQMCALAAILFGAALLVGALTLAARAKGRSAWLGLVGLFSIVGVISVMCLADHRREHGHLCPTRECGYDRTGLAADAKCPECGVAPGGV